MQLHNLQPRRKRRVKKRVGRGGKRGTYSGRGVKGQKARAGHRIRPAVRDTIKQLPKKRGYKAKRFHTKPAIVNMHALQEAFSDGERVTPQALVEKGLVRMRRGRMPAVKILARGEIQHRLSVENCQCSKGAAEKIAKAGGKVQEATA